jgi:GntR family transcriptional regulator/MocR family aminotransferase
MIAYKSIGMHATKAGDADRSVVRDRICSRTEPEIFLLMDPVSVRRGENSLDQAPARGIFSNWPHRERSRRMQIQLSLLIDRSRSDTLTDQLVCQLRDAIRAGRIAPGVCLPSSRRLSEQLGIGRNTVVRAYETLAMECTIASRPASGMYALGASAQPSPAVLTRKEAARPIAVAPKGSRLSFDFAPGCPNTALFPLKTWRRVLQGCLSGNGATGLSQAGDPFGLATLRAAIANHLAAARGIAAEPGQVIIVSGTVEAIALATRVLVAPGSSVALENPADRRAADIFAASGASLHPVAVDDQGIITDDLPANPTALLYVTPAHQYPTGHALCAARRGAAIAWARRSGCIIVEDDAGSMFCYDGAPSAPIAADAPDCTVHVGSFSQSLGGGLRLGYVVVPPRLVDAALAAKLLLNAGSPWLEQAVVAEMIGSGSYAAHLMRMRSAYRERRDQLLDALGRNFGDLEISGAAGGMHLFWQLPAGVPDAATVEALGRRARVGVYALTTDRIWQEAGGALARRGLMLGYANLTLKQIEQGIARLSDAVDDALDGRRIGLGDLLTHRAAAPRPAAALVGRRRAKPAPRIAQQPALPPLPAHRAASRHGVGREAGSLMPVVKNLFQYPIKGLSPQPLARVTIAAGKPFPFDRIFALARPGGAITAEAPKWAKKGLFVMLMLDEGLARVRTHLDAETLLLTVHDGDRTTLRADLREASDRARVEKFFHRLAPSLAAPPILVRAEGGHFMDKPDSVISLINLATVRSLEALWGAPLDPLRFRANVAIDDAVAWAEFDWIGSDIRIGGVVFRVDRRNGRCGATNVDPASGRRDLDIPGSLRRSFGHKDLGVYLVARTDGDFSVGDRLELPGVGTAAAPAPVPPPKPAYRGLICRGCYYIFTEGPGVGRFADLPANWQCPDCGTDKSNFRPHALPA